MPATSSARGSVSRVSRSTSTPAGSWNEPTRFLPAAVLMPVLPPTAASTIASSVVGHVHDPHPAQPGRGHEAAEVGGRAAAERDHRVGAGEPGLAERVPALDRHLGRLGRLTGGQPEREDVVLPRAARRAPARRARRARRRRGTPPAARPAPRIAGSRSGETAADHDVVRRRATRRAGRCRSSDALLDPGGDLGCHVLRAPAVGVDRDPGEALVDRRPLVEQLLDPRPDVAEQQRAGRRPARPA